MNTTHGYARREHVADTLPQHLAVSRLRRPPSTSPGGRRVALLSVAVVFVVTVAACGGQTPTSPPSPSTPGPSTPTTATPATVTAATSANVPPAASGPMTGDELVWLERIAALHKTMDDLPSIVTATAMRSLADKLGGCTRTLDGFGSLTERLRPVYDLARQACTRYEKSAECFATAATLGVVIAGSAEEQRQKEATDCAFAAVSEGSKLFADAESKGFEVRNAAH